MNGLVATISPRVADVSAASQSMRAYVAPLMITLGGLAAVVATFFLVVGGIHYITSTGKPDKLEHAKKVIRNALIGLVMVIAAGTLTAILLHAYQSSGGAGTEQLPALAPIQPAPTSNGLVDVLINAILGLFRYIVESAALPFIKGLEYFTHATPLMAVNASVFDIWLAMTGIADALFVLVVALLGFHVMSFAALGLDEIEFKHLLPQLAIAFLFINTSIFAIDMVIGLSNALITALNSVFPGTSVWTALSSVATQANGMSLVALLIMVAFMVLAVVLMIYYITRLVVLYIGAILSPLIILLWLLPGFKDFAVTAIKTYLTTIFVLFIHVVILLLAASIFAGMVIGSADKSLNPLMATLVGIATLIALLKTQGLLAEMSYVSLGPKAMRKLGSQFVTSVSHVTSKMKTAAKAAE
ncbi:MAG: hypothetical protein U0516_02585 [Candidatus Saccharibacteria bacterium]